ncbi:MAG TPA: amidohydrolase family protein [Burkholderiales bacterium]|nr:amidohydrolase family protein [Burkholderiales bacterium]
MLIRNALAIMTGLPGDQARAPGGDIRIDAQGRIAAIGRLAPAAAERVLDATDCVVYPGWVNTHHHLAQSVLRGVPAGINLPLAGWLSAVAYPYRRRFDAELLGIAAEVGMVDLVLSGCTTIADHHYIYWPGMGYDPAKVLFDLAQRLGIRFVLCRGGATLQRAFELNDPNAIKPETLDTIVGDLERLVGTYHDPGPEAMRRVVMAPATPTWSVRPEELKPMAHAARRLGIRLHSHLSETADYVVYCREQHGRKPVEFVADHEWVGNDVWFAHMVHLSESEIRLVAETGTGTAHCPGSNCRLGSGVAPVPELVRAGAPVSIGVDGTASNEGGDSISEAHICWYVHRAVKGASATTVEDVIHWGTRGGARVLGLDNVGTIEVGRAADLAVYELDQLRYAGLHDPAIGPVASGGHPKLRLLTVQGRVVVENDAIPGLDLPRLLARARAAVRKLAA